MKILKSVIFVKKKLSYKIVKLEIIVIIQGGYRGASHSICSLKYSVPKKNIYSFS